jgi:hypothetical protein
MRVAKNRGSLSYTCWINAQRPTAGEKSFHVCRLVSRVDTFVVDLLIDRLSRPDAVELFARDDAAMAELRSLLDLVAEKRAELNAFYDLAAKGQLSAMGLARAEQGLLPEIERLEERGQRIRLVPLLGDLVNSDAEIVRDRWDGLETSQQRELIKAIFSRITVVKVGKGRRGYTDWESVQVEWRRPTEGDITLR